MKEIVIVLLRKDADVGTSVFLGLHFIRQFIICALLFLDWSQTRPLYHSLDLVTDTLDT